MSSLLIVPALAGYLLGSIPFGLLLTRMAGLGDIRSIGSGNIGATNVLRTGSKGLAAATLLLDALKGAAAVSLGPVVLALVLGLAGDGGVQSGPDLRAQLTAAALAGGYGAFLGHLYPVWLGFKGGKGVATFIGVLLALFWPAAAGFCLIWLAVAFGLRYSSLSALVAALAVPVITYALGRADLAIMMVPLVALLIFKHHANIRRLAEGTEPKIGAKT